MHTASFPAVRGYTLGAALCDEVAFWPQENSATPDEERSSPRCGRASASIPGSMLLCASSPHARRGELWQAYRRWHGKDNAPALVWHADTSTMNPTISERVITVAYENDPVRAAAEYGAQFRSDVETFVAREVVEACVEPGIKERARLSQYRYSAFVDPSGGSSDSMTIAIVHKERADGFERVVIDVIREARAPFNPTDVVAELAKTLKGYGVSRVRGDRYAGEWPAEAFRRHGITYAPAEKPKSVIYGEALRSLELSPCQPPRPTPARRPVGRPRAPNRAGWPRLDRPCTGRS